MFQQQFFLFKCCCWFNPQLKMMTMTFQIWVCWNKVRVLPQNKIVQWHNIEWNYLLLIEHFSILLLQIFKVFCLNFSNNHQRIIYLTVTTSTHTHTPLIKLWRVNWMRQMLLSIVFVLYIFWIANLHRASSFASLWIKSK